MFIPLRHKLLRIALLGCIVMTMGLALVPGASANVRVPSRDMPFYAGSSSTAQHVSHTTTSGPFIPFYRPTRASQPDFNLITLVDYPRPSRVRRIPPTDSRSGRADEPVPLLWQLHGLGAVPVWFVRWPELARRAGRRSVDHG